MAERFLLDNTGTCKACKSVPIDGEELSCFLCKNVFHGTCPEDELKVATKTCITHFNKPSTKGNFKFYCNVCLTKMEMDFAKNDNDRLTSVEDRVLSVKNELDQMKNLLLKQNEKSSEQFNELKSLFQASVPTKIDNDTVTKKSIWHDKERLEKTKIPPVKPMLILNKKDNNDVSNASVEKVIFENKIPVTKTYTNDRGDLVMECDSLETREKLKTLSDKSNLALKPVVGRKDNITIVGLKTNCSADEVVDQLVTQNQFLQQFSMVNDFKEHFTVHSIKPTKNNDQVFQVFASVSNQIRKGFANHNDKVTLGLIVCKIYDRLYVKRCNNCQGLGHYYKDCTTPLNPICAKCSESHRTDACTSDVRKCTNCVKNKYPFDHATFDPNCPSSISFSSKAPAVNLN